MYSYIISLLGDICKSFNDNIKNLLTFLLPPYVPAIYYNLKASSIIVSAVKPGKFSFQ